MLTGVNFQASLCVSASLCAVTHPPTTGQSRSKKCLRLKTSSEPLWLDPRNDRKTLFTDAELEILADDFIAAIADTPAWQDLVAEVGERQAREVAKKRLAAQDANSLLNWQPDGPLH